MVLFFNESVNTEFVALCQLVNAVAEGKKYTKEELVSILQSAYERCEPDRQREEAMIETIFSFDAKHYAQLSYEQGIKLTPRLYELSWLKAMLMDETAKFLLNTDLRSKLLEALENVESLAVAVKNTVDKNNDDEMQKKLSILHHALLHKQKIYCEYLSDTKLYRVILSPLRLEYDIVTGVYSLFGWQENSAEPCKIGIDSLQKLELMNEYYNADLQQDFGNFLQKKRQRLVLRLKPKYNAFDRCYELFAEFDKESQLVDDDIYQLTIFYYEFDQQEVLEKVISLGSSVVVEEPPVIRHAVIEHLKAVQKSWKCVMAADAQAEQ